jgi:hypothetical protein
MAANTNIDPSFPFCITDPLISPCTFPEIRKYAQSIVRQTVQQINHKADEIPDDVALMKENELLQAVINELQTLKH